MPATVIYYTNAHQRDACADRLTSLGYYLRAVTDNLDTALRIIERGEAKVLMAAKPSVFGDRLAEVEGKLDRLDAILEYAQPTPRRRRTPKTPERLRLVLGQLEDGVAQLRDIVGSSDVASGDRRTHPVEPRTPDSDDPAGG